MRRSDYADIAVFIAVAEERSFRRAGARLGLAPSSVSHVVSALEKRLGVRLLNRTTRSVAPTDAGKHLVERTAPAMTSVAVAVDQLHDMTGVVAGTVRLSVPRVAADLALMPVLAAFLRERPHVRVEFSADEAFVDAVGEGFDAGIRLGHHIDQDMVAVRITPDLRTAIVGSSAYFAEYGRPEHPRHLRNHRCIGWRQKASGAVFDWHFEKDGEIIDLKLDSPLTTDDPLLMIDAARDGIGLAWADEPLVTADLAVGLLERVLEPWCPRRPGFYLYYPSRHGISAALRALIDELIARRERETAAHAWWSDH